jgi:hypothetical protein
VHAGTVHLHRSLSNTSWPSVTVLSSGAPLQGAEFPEGDDGLSVDLLEEGLGRGGVVSGGVFDHGAYEEDGPGTWEVLAAPRKKSGVAESR